MIDACQNNICGRYSLCHSVKGRPVCSCLPGFFGKPPHCGYDNSCMDSNDCVSNETCIEDKCINPCEMGICGKNSLCTVINHNMICSCESGYVGNPFKGCKPMPRELFLLICCHLSFIDDIVLFKFLAKQFIHPCTKSPCHCAFNRHINDYSCNCLPNFIDPLPNCKSECRSNAECPMHMACLNQFCKNPCVDEMCGENAMCKVKMHKPVCECKQNYTGNPFVKCFHTNHMQKFLRSISYECKRDDECAGNRACMHGACKSPCNEAYCGVKAECRVFNHVPNCFCHVGYTGDPRHACHPMPLLSK